MATVNGIKVTPDLLRNDAKKINDFRARHDEIIQQLNTLVSGLNDVWIGESQTAFAQEYEAMKPTFRKFSEILGKYATEMTNSANRIEEADKQAAAQTRNSFSGL